MAISTAGWIGIAAGLALAVFEYWFLVDIARKNIQASDPNDLESRLRPFKMLMAAGFVILPLVGYLIANLLFD